MIRMVINRDWAFIYAKNDKKQRLRSPTVEMDGGRFRNLKYCVIRSNLPNRIRSMSVLHWKVCEVGDRASLCLFVAWFRFFLVLCMSFSIDSLLVPERRCLLSAVARSYCSKPFLSSLSVLLISIGEFIKCDTDKYWQVH